MDSHPFELEGRGPVVDWCHTAGVAFTDPCFDQTVEACFRNPFRLLFRRETGIEEVGRFVADHPGLAPAGFVFHMSRCGSTLVSQMLAAVPAHLVLAEAGPFDTVLRAHHVAVDERAAWLRWMVGALGQRRDDRQKRLFVKFDAWSAIDLPLVRLAFPDVPWMFLYRDPVEVLVSHVGRAGAHMIPGALDPGPAGRTPDGAARHSLGDYGARALARICEAALELRDDPMATFVEYGQLPNFVVSDLKNVWSLPLGPAESELMLAAAGRDAKNPVLVYEDDRARKQAMATPEVRAAAERWLAPLYERLEDVRTGAHAV